MFVSFVGCFSGGDMSANLPELGLRGIHHIAIICSDYERSRRFYVDVLGLEVLAEHYREDRQSYKLDLSVGGPYQIELFSLIRMRRASFACATSARPSSAVIQTR